MKFLVDAMLGKLARFLRIFGYDTIYANDLEEQFQLSPVPDSKLLDYAKENDRIIITRDLPFHKMAGNDRSVYLEGNGVYNYLKQLKDTLNIDYEFILKDARCSVCNGILEKVNDNNSIKDQVENDTLKHYNTFFQCLDCKKIYWKGSHIKKIMKELKKN